MGVTGLYPCGRFFFVPAPDMHTREIPPRLNRPTHLTGSSTLEPTKKRLTTFPALRWPNKYLPLPFQLRPSTARRAPRQGSVRPGVEGHAQ